MRGFAACMAALALTGPAMAFDLKVDREAVSRALCQKIAAAPLRVLDMPVEAVEIVLWV